MIIRSTEIFFYVLKYRYEKGLLLIKQVSFYFVLSLQGLAALCEKEENPQLKAELPDVYNKLLQLYERYSQLCACM